MADFERSTFRQYLNDIGRYPLLTPTEEIEMGRLVKRKHQLEELERPLTPSEKREVRKGKRAEERLIKGNMRLVVYIAKKYVKRTYHLDICDLMQEGAVGLTRAAALFDPERGYKFSTYAYWWIRQGITRALNNNDRLIRRPISVAEISCKLPKIIHQLGAELDRMPTKAEIAAEAKLSVEELDLIYQRGGTIASLDMLVGNDQSSTLIEHITDPNALTVEEQEDLMESERQWHQVEAYMASLPESDQVCIKERYGLNGMEPRTLHAIGDDLGISKERVRQKVVIATQKMKRALNPGPAESHTGEALRVKAKVPVCNRALSVAPDPRWQAAA